MLKLYYRTKFYQGISCVSTALRTIYRNLRGKKFEPEVALLKDFISAGDVCFDIGAAYGRYALPLSRLAGTSGKIYCFEPGTYSFNVLSFIAHFHRLRNVVLVKRALSDREGKIKLALPVKKSGKLGPSLAYLSAQDAPDALSEEVQMTTIDAFCAERQIPRLDFIKCDVEGAELLVFSGGSRTIERYKSVILSEVDAGNLAKFGHDKRKLQDFFLQAGYRIFLLEDSRLAESGQITKDANYLFIHRSRAMPAG
jgi:FkbM family methyltransferase